MDACLLQRDDARCDLTSHGRARGQATLSRRTRRWSARLTITAAIAGLRQRAEAFKAVVDGFTEVTGKRRETADGDT